MATIITKNSSTASSVPLNTQLVQGELAVNVTDKRLFTENASGTVVELGTNPSTLVTSNTFLAFGRGNTEDMRLTSTGLGIGTSSPNEKLVVNGAVRSSSNAVSVTASAGAVMDYFSGMARFFATDGSAVGQMNLDKAGNLGLGVTPSAWTSAWKVLQNQGGFFGANATNSLRTASNSYSDGTNWRYVNNGSAAAYQIADNTHQWHVAPSGTAGNAITFTQAMTLDASGNLLVARTANYNVGTYQSQKIKVTGGIGINSDSADNVARLTLLGDSATGDGTIDWGGNGNFNLKFTNNGSERARIDSSGNLLVGTTTSSGLFTGNVVNTGFVVEASGSIAKQRNDDSCAYWSKASGYTSGSFHAFWVSGSQVGGITTNGTSTSYNTSSDYRLKENIQPMTGALAKVQALKPCTYKWKADGSDGEGFIAHELAEVVPQCVTGEKDAVDAEGNPVYQGIDTSFLVATLTAAIQEQQAIIQSLTARVAALEAA